MEHPGFVYYIACTESGRLKIGYTSGDVRKRLKALQTGSPTPLTVMAYHPASRDYERDLHEKFSAHRLVGEWFDMSEELFMHIGAVTWMAARIAIANGEPIEDWTRIGLQSMQDDISPLPDDLAALIA